MLRSFLLAPSVPVEEVQVAENATALECMWWVAGDYQLCLTGTDAHDELVRSDGRFYKLQHGPSLRSRFPHWLAGTVEAGMMHFQEWKKAYPYWYARPQSGSPAPPSSRLTRSIGVCVAGPCRVRGLAMRARL